MASNKGNLLYLTLHLLYFLSLVFESGPPLCLIKEMLVVVVAQCFTKFGNALLYLSSDGLVVLL